MAYSFKLFFCDAVDTTPAPSKYVRDPDDEDTLSPVMVPIASPDTSSCHSNNNFESDFSDMTPHEHHQEVAAKSKAATAESHYHQQQQPAKKAPAIHHHQAHPHAVKRARSPSGQVCHLKIRKTS